MKRILFALLAISLFTSPLRADYKEDLKKGDYKAVEELGGALDALKKDDTPGMLSRIKKAASWLYEETKEIQAKVLMFVIEKYVLNKL